MIIFHQDNIVFSEYYKQTLVLSIIRLRSLGAKPHDRTISMFLGAASD